MFFGRRSNNAFSGDVTDNGSVIERVTRYKYLGLILDSDLSFKPHIEYVAGKVSSVVGMLYTVQRTMYRTRGFVPRHVLINLYYCLIHCNLTYLLEVYGSAGKKDLKRDWKYFNERL